MGHCNGSDGVPKAVLDAAGLMAMESPLMQSAQSVSQVGSKIWAVAISGHTGMGTTLVHLPYLHRANGCSAHKWVDEFRAITDALHGNNGLDKWCDK